MTNLSFLYVAPSATDYDFRMNGSVDTMFDDIGNARDFYSGKLFFTFSCIFNDFVIIS